MTSQLNVDTIVDKAGSGGTNVKMANTSVTVSEGGATTTTTVQGLCKAYGYAQQRTATVELKDSFNISSWSDDGTGTSTWNINSDMANTTYTPVVSSSYDATQGSSQTGSDEVWITGAGVFKQDTFFGNATYYDTDYVFATVHGDLA